MTNARRAEIADFIERTWRSRTPARDVMDALPTQRVTFTDILAAFPELTALDREETVPIHNRVMRRLRREFPDERWA